MLIGGNGFGNTQYVNSVFTAVIDVATKKISGYKRTEMEESFIDQFSQRKFAFTKNNKSGLYPFKMRAFELSDGTLDIIGGLSRMETDYSGKSVSVRFYAGSILNVNFTNGKAVMTRIPRIRFTFTPTGQSFYAIQKDNTIIVLYNDIEKNLQMANDAMPEDSENLKNVVVVAATVKDGNLIRKAIIDERTDNYLAEPHFTKGITETIYIMPLLQTKGIEKTTGKHKMATVSIQ